jgi:ectoine hydroxylase-related dioxygenase (phytanoyl-CoA dioxygenase family)
MKKAYGLGLVVVPLVSIPTVMGFRIPLQHTRTTVTHLLAVVSEGKFMYMTEEEDRLLKEKGDLEEQLMQSPTPIKPLKIRTRRHTSNSGGNGGSGMGMGGFGSRNGDATNKVKGGKKRKQSASGGQTKSQKSPLTSPQEPSTIKPIIKAIQEDGMVRIDNVLSPKVADNLRDYLIDLRARSTADIEEGRITNSQERFADVLLNQNRCDLKIPLGPPPVNEALFDLLIADGDSKTDNNTVNPCPSIVRSVIEGVYDSYHGQGKHASLWELNCFMSNAGARRQLVHADNVCLEPVQGLQEGEPIILTCFIALQDIDASMGPTVFMPKTHSIDAHNRFFETGRDEASTKTDTYSPKNEILKSSPSIMGAPLPKGSCILFDPRVLHCAGANVCRDTQKTRALFYLSFKNPKVDDPGCPSTSGYGISTAELTMDQLVTDLLHERRGEPARHLALLASSP